jgi:hypothetical protein
MFSMAIQAVGHTNVLEINFCPIVSRVTDAALLGVMRGRSHFLMATKAIGYGVTIGAVTRKVCGILL